MEYLGSIWKSNVYMFTWLDGARATDSDRIDSLVDRKNEYNVERVSTHFLLEQITSSNSFHLHIHHSNNKYTPHGNKTNHFHIA